MDSSFFLPKKKKKLQVCLRKSLNLNFRFSELWHLLNIYSKREWCWENWLLFSSVLIFCDETKARAEYFRCRLRREFIIQSKIQHFVFVKIGFVEKVETHYNLIKNFGCFDWGGNIHRWWPNPYLAFCVIGRVVFPVVCWISLDPFLSAELHFHSSPVIILIAEINVLNNYILINNLKNN